MILKFSFTYLGKLIFWLGVLNVKCKEGFGDFSEINESYRKCIHGFANIKKNVSLSLAVILK